jgi:hypothetical protein
VEKGRGEDPARDNKKTTDERKTNMCKHLMQKKCLTALPVIMVIVGVSSCDSYEDKEPIPDSEISRLVDPDSAQELTDADNFTLIGFADEEPSVRTKRVNYGICSTVSQGQLRLWSLTTAPGAAYFATVKPVNGDPDLYVFRQNGTQWIAWDDSLNDANKVDRLKVQLGGSEKILLGVYGYAASGFTFSISWETNGVLDLDVPYLNQNSLSGGIGPSACSSASAAMILATHGIVALNQMGDAAQDAFEATASMAQGLLGRDLLKNYLIDAGDFSSVSIDTSGWNSLYNTIKSEVRAGRPLILGSKSMSTAGHYAIITGFIGESYDTARLIVNDPNGVWTGWNKWTPGSSGEGAEYDFTDITSKTSDGVFVIIP